MTKQQPLTTKKRPSQRMRDAKSHVGPLNPTRRFYDQRTTTQKRGSQMSVTRPT